MIYRLWFKWDRCGWASRSHHYGESESIIFLNKELQWHKSSQEPSEDSPNAGGFFGATRCLEFQSPDEVVDYLISIDFAKALCRASKKARNGRDLNSLCVVQVESAGRSSEYYDEFRVNHFLSVYAGSEVADLIELQVKEMDCH